MKLLLELRPAFDGHAGIPQETRLLFRGLSAPLSAGRTVVFGDLEGQLACGVAEDRLATHLGRVLRRGGDGHGEREQQCQQGPSARHAQNNGAAVDGERRDFE